MEIEIINIDQIREQLKEKGFVKKLISYKELQELYKQYGKGMTEANFAQIVLDISNRRYLACKNTGSKVWIFKNEKTSEAKIEEIKERLKENGYVGKLISYKELQELYKEYGKGMTEIDFAQVVLDISYCGYLACKNTGSKVGILKNEKTSEAKIEEIKERLKEKGYVKKLISYEELQELYKEYGKEMTERDFAEKVLDISYRGYSACKNKGSKVWILKNEKISKDSEEVKEVKKVKEVREKLKAKGYIGKSISYEELQELYKEYGKGMTERDFAEKVLDIYSYNYYRCKEGRGNVRILKQEKMSEEVIEKIKKELKAKGYIGKSISYEELQELYKEYGKGMTEREFVQKVLGLSYANYMNCKSRGRNVRILKQEKSPEKEIEEIIEELKAKGYIGKSISYEELQELHKEYGKGIKEVDFARSVLGISYYNYVNCRNKVSNILIKDGIVYKRAKEITELYLTKPDYYSKQFIHKICKKYNITLDEFITYCIIKGFYDVTEYIEVLEEKEKIWIGKTKLSQEFTAINIDLIQKIAKKVSSSVCGKYRLIEREEDWQQELIIYIIENMGAEERNFGHNIEQFEERVFRKAKKYCQGNVISELKIGSKYRGLTRLSRHSNNNGGFQIEVEDEHVNIEEIVERKEDNKLIESESDECIRLLSQYVELGYSKKEAIAMTAQKMNVDESKMLEYMQQYLLTRGMVRIRKDGKVERVER